MVWEVGREKSKKVHLNMGDDGDRCPIWGNAVHIDRSVIGCFGSRWCLERGFLVPGTCSCMEILCKSRQFSLKSFALACDVPVTV
jgi:hypothetical protein